MSRERPSRRLATVCVDCADAHVMADFYGHLLGWEVAASEPDWVLMRDPRGGTGLSFQAEANYRRPGQRSPTLRTRCCISTCRSMISTPPSNTPSLWGHDCPNISRKQAYVC